MPSDASTVAAAAPNAPAGRPKSGGGSWPAKLALLGFSILVPVIAIEVGLRLFGHVTDVPFMFWDPLIGPRRIPNQTGQFNFKDNVRGTYRFNAQGWNNPHEYRTQKPPGTRRVCIVGDSFVEAMQVPVEQACFSVAEKQMNRPDRPVEWYSFGSSGLGTTHEYLIIRHYVLDYHPDVVVLLFVSNDPTDCSPYLVAQEPWMAQMRLAPDGTLALTPPVEYRPSRLNRFLASFALVRYLKVQRGMFAGAAAGAAAGQSSVREGAGQGGPQDPVLAALPLGDRVELTWQLIETLLAACKRECAEHGAQFMVAYQGHRWAIQAARDGTKYTPPAREVDPYCQLERVYDMGDQYLAPITRKLKIPYLDLTPALIEEQRSAGRRCDFPEDAHFNDVGHAAAGKAMAAWIERAWTAPAGSL